jgi:hypothetical protein
MNEHMVNAVKASLARVLPGALVLFVGVMLMLAIGITVVVEGPGIVRPLTAPLPQPFRSLALIASLGIPLVVLGWCGKRLLGYGISLSGRSQRGD